MADNEQDFFYRLNNNDSLPRPRQELSIFCETTAVAAANPSSLNFNRINLGEKNTIGDVHK